MTYLQKLIQSVVDICSPVGTVCNFAGACPTGWMIIDDIKVYEDEHTRLYNYLVVNPNLEKGQDEDGRKWVKMVNPEGRVLQCTTSVSNIWKLLEACLPNMVSKMAWPYMGITYQSNRYALEGAFYQTTEKFNDNASFNGTADSSKPNLIGFDPNRVNDLYSGNSLQVSALQVLCCIKS